jgi:hypothetical protein
MKDVLARWEKRPARVTMDYWTTGLLTPLILNVGLHDC